MVPSPLSSNSGLVTINFYIWIQLQCHTHAYLLPILLQLLRLSLLLTAAPFYFRTKVWAHLVVDITNTIKLTLIFIITITIIMTSAITITITTTITPQTNVACGVSGVLTCLP